LQSSVAVAVATVAADCSAIRPSLLTSHHEVLALEANGIGYGSTNSGPASLMANPPAIPNAWIYSDHIVNNAGHRLAANLVATACPDDGQPPSGLPAPGSSTRTFVPAGAQNALEDCAVKIGASYHQFVTYQPAYRYWELQWLETAILFVGAAALLGCCVWWLRHRSP
jgi:hypothetical protein